MEHLRQKFYYKLCVYNQGKIMNYMDRSYEFQIGQSITQDISQPSPYLYVYKTSEIAISSESGYTSREKSNIILPKIVIKLMCWGNCIETPRKFAFSNMCVVEKLNLQPEISTRASSKLKYIKNLSTRREISPRGIKSNRDNSPVRIYSSVVARKKSPSSFFNTVRNKGKVQDILRKMKEETDKLDKEIRDIENWNKYSGLEELESIYSSDTVDNVNN